MRAYLFDIDGTLADLSHRLHHIKPEYDRNGLLPAKNWDAFFAACISDVPIHHMIALVRIIIDADQTVIFISGRSDQVRAETETWLERHVGYVGPLYMRKHGDHRPDRIVKGELLDQILTDGFEPIMAFEDRDQTVEMFRKAGIPCAQVAFGNF